jgi:hypothetical protein
MECAGTFILGGVFYGALTSGFLFYVVNNLVPPNIVTMLLLAQSITKIAGKIAYNNVQNWWCPARESDKPAEGVTMRKLRVVEECKD